MSNVNRLNEIRDPLKFASIFWPDLQFYKEQMEIIYSVHLNDITVVPAANMMGDLPPL